MLEKEMQIKEAFYYLYWKYDDVNEKENVKTVNLNIVCKVKGK